MFKLLQNQNTGSYYFNSIAQWGFVVCFVCSFFSQCFFNWTQYSSLLLLGCLPVSADILVENGGQKQRLSYYLQWVEAKHAMKHSGKFKKGPIKWIILPKMSAVSILENPGLAESRKDENSHVIRKETYPHNLTKNRGQFYFYALQTSAVEPSDLKLLFVKIQAFRFSVAS